jgi:acetyl-CoA carboxylase biotin carboxyl carrier protein
VSELLERLGSEGVQALELRRGELRVRVSRDAGRVAAETVRRAGDAAGDTAAEPAPAVAAKEITAPLTGIFYRAPSPQTAPFVQIGTPLAVGDVIGLIEAMKLFNEIRATVAGRVRRILVENGQLVRAHQPLMELE